MRLVVILLIVVFAACAMLASHARKPFTLRIDAQSPGAWQRYASANRVEMIDQQACMRLMTPYRVTSEPRKGVTMS